MFHSHLPIILHSVSSFHYLLKAHLFEKENNCLQVRLHGHLVCPKTCSSFFKSTRYKMTLKYFSNPEKIQRYGWSPARLKQHCALCRYLTAYFVCNALVEPEGDSDWMKNTHKPAHLFSRHGFICLLGPTHFPSYFGGGLVQVRSRVLVPFPQVFEHFDQAAQFDQRPFT